ncbi:MAG: hypothetical protein R6V03_08225 [Kiritimatiellia bacterium]
MKRILIVDDQHSTVDFLNRALGRQGYDILEAYNGEDAFRIY